MDLAVPLLMERDPAAETEDDLVAVGVHLPVRPRLVEGVHGHEPSFRTVASVALAAARIIRDPKVMLGKPILEGTRITVEYILEQLEDGETIESIVGEHPTLTREGVEAAIAYARAAVQREAGAAK